MQSITTKYLPPGNVRGARIKASCERGSITISYPHELSGWRCYEAAAKALVAKFLAEDAKEGRYATPPDENPWGKPMVCGAPCKAGGYVFSWPEIDSNQCLVQFANREDLEMFKKCAVKAKVQEGSIAPLYLGLLCSTLNRAMI